PLSFAQQRLWFLDQLAPGMIAYNSPAIIHMDGPLHLAALQQSLTAMLQRHEILRTIFVGVEGTPAQVITAPRPLTLPVADLQALSGADREAEVERLSTAEARRPFGLALGPLLRTTL